eukprot:363256-Chlamydomonas_euryale.AAC.7
MDTLTREHHAPHSQERLSEWQCAVSLCKRWPWACAERIPADSGLHDAEPSRAHNTVRAAEREKWSAPPPPPCTAGRGHASMSTLKTYSGMGTIKGNDIWIRVDPEANHSTV